MERLTEICASACKEVRVGSLFPVKMLHFSRQFWICVVRRIGASGIVLCLLSGCGDEKDTTADVINDKSELSLPAHIESSTAEIKDGMADKEEEETGAFLPSIPGVFHDRLNGQMAPIIAKSNFISQEWNTEIFTLAVNHQLGQIAKWLESGTVKEEQMKMVALEEVRSATLQRSSLQIVFEDSLVQVKRWNQQGNDEPTYETGLGAISSHLNELVAPLQPAVDRHVTFKTYRVEPATDRVATTAQFHANGSLGNGTIEQSATLRFKWTAERQPRLVTVEVESYEEVTPSATGGIKFADRAPEVFRKEPSYSTQLAKGSDHWRKHLQADFGIDVNGLQGIALGDANGDGLEDLYVCQHGGLPNKLYLRNPDGTLRDVSETAGVDWMELTRAALFIDLDNDGDQDLAMTQGWYWVLMENDGNAKFTKRSETSGSAWYYSLAAADYDNDGDIDLYICGRNPIAEQGRIEGFLGTPIPFHDANNGGANILLKNEGDWSFSDVTAESGMDVHNRRYSYAAVWEDYDNDGDQDLYVANDFGRNCLYRNNRGRFSEIAAEAGVEDISAGMGVTWADVNHDGNMDLHVSNMFSSAGNRIAYQRHFREESGSSRTSYRRHARGNSLFTNKGNGTFSDISTGAAITLGRWAWGARFADFNNDGWEDLFVANGFVTTEDTGDL
ncbi:MAG: hypothetical protein ACI9R3_003652 [Verrucomicrobiales bacterium]|jgi:hypothetical protein